MSDLALPALDPADLLMVLALGFCLLLVLVVGLLAIIIRESGDGPVRVTEDPFGRAFGDQPFMPPHDLTDLNIEHFRRAGFQ